VRQPHLVRHPHRLRQPHLHLMKQSFEVASSAPQGSILIFALVSSAVIKGVPHFRVNGSVGVPAVPAIISMSECTLYSVYTVLPNWFISLAQAKANTLLFVLD
jgi:hypothetical protein